MNFNYFSGLFSGLSNNSGNSFYASLSDYSSIKSGSYKKLLNAYYDTKSGKTSSAAGDILSGKNADSTDRLKTVDKTLTDVKSSADKLVKSATAMYSKGKGSVFSADAGSEDTIKGVKQFVSDYNNLLDSTKNTVTRNVTSTTKFLTGTVNTYAKSLENIGITIGSDNKLTIDEDKLKNAGEDAVKSIFNGTSSLSFAVASKATTIGNYAQSAAATTGSSSFNQYL